MTLRSTLSELLCYLRAQINDAGETRVFTDTELQGILDAQRVDVRYMTLTPVENISSAGVVSYLQYRAPVSFDGYYWETGATLCAGDYAALTATSVDYQNGIWTFAATQSPPVLVTGSCYNVALSAADAFERWAGKVALDFDFTADGSTYHRSQKLAALRSMAALMRSNAPARCVQVYV